MSTLSEQAALANAPGFQARVRAAMTAAANSIAQIAQGATPAQTYALRIALATAVAQNAMPYLDRFAWSMATNASVFNDMFEPVAVAGVAAGAPAVIATVVPHNLTANQIVQVDLTAEASVNGTWIVLAVLDATHFSVPAPSDTFAPPGGTITRQPADASLQTAVNTVWNTLAGVTSATV